MPHLRYTIPALILLMGADCVTTYYGLGLGATEANQIGRTLINESWALAIALKAAVLVLAVWIVWHYRKHGFAQRTVNLWCLGMTFVVAQNIRVLAEII